VSGEAGSKFEVCLVTGQNGVPWAAWGDRTPFPLGIAADEKLDGSTEELAVGLSLAADLSKDVLEYSRAQLPNVGTYVCIAPEVGASNVAIATAAQARDWAYGVRDAIRGIVRERGVSRIHLFLATPAGAALLLGHLWDRMPFTQLYEDLGPLRGYAPSFLLPN
jgi:hypothetical protein